MRHGFRNDDGQLSATNRIANQFRPHRRIHRRKKEPKFLSIEELRKISAEYAQRTVSPYAEYLKSEHWRVFRAGIIAERGNRCEDCGCNSRRVQVHHLTYLRVGAELPSDVKVLCARCHRHRHALASKSSLSS